MQRDGGTDTSLSSLRTYAEHARTSFRSLFAQSAENADMRGGSQLFVPTTTEGK